MALCNLRTLKAGHSVSELNRLNESILIHEQIILSFKGAITIYSLDDVIHLTLLKSSVQDCFVLHRKSSHAVCTHIWHAKKYKTFE